MQGHLSSLQHCILIVLYISVAKIGVERGGVRPKGPKSRPKVKRGDRFRGQR